MGIELQRAGLWKRIAAWLLDFILLCVLAVGAAYGLSLAIGYEGTYQQLESHYGDYEARYNTTFDISQQDYEALSEQEKKTYDEAYEALIADDEVLYTYNLLINQSLLITSVGILVAMLILEFAVPLALKNGQTVGKKCFGLGLVRKDGVQLNHLQLFTRTLLGKYTIGTMLPVYVFMLMFWGGLGMIGTVLLAGLLLGQVICVSVTRNNSAIQDLLAGTAVVDLASQQIFKSTDDLVAHVKRVHAERAKRQEY